jgi:hypothetical protein
MFSSGSKVDAQAFECCESVTGLADIKRRRQRAVRQFSDNPFRSRLGVWIGGKDLHSPFACHDELHGNPQIYQQVHKS